MCFFDIRLGFRSYIVNNHLLWPLVPEERDERKHVGSQPGFATDGDDAHTVSNARGSAYPAAGKPVGGGQSTCGLAYCETQQSEPHEHSDQPACHDQQHYGGRSPPLIHSRRSMSFLEYFHIFTTVHNTETCHIT